MFYEFLESLEEEKKKSGDRKDVEKRFGEMRESFGKV